MSYYIGVDGGGTKSLIALFDENKNLLDSVKTSGSNHECLEGSFNEAAEVILGGIDKLLENNSLSRDDVTAYLMGLAGIDHPYQHDILADILQKDGLRNFRIYNDGFIITKAGLENGVGIGYNCGTGTCCNSIAADGKMLQIGGFGELSGDMGNGHWIASMAFRAIYDDVCLGFEKTAMSGILTRLTGIAASREELLASIGRFESEESAEDYIRILIDVYFEALNSGDAAAERIADEMALRGAKFITAHIKKQDFGEGAVNVVLSGSMHAKLPSELYVEKLKEKCRELTDRELKFTVLDKQPVTGCINWMLENNG